MKDMTGQKNKATRTSIYCNKKIIASITSGRKLVMPRDVVKAV